jgi:hypothetical protein
MRVNNSKEFEKLLEAVAADAFQAQDYRNISKSLMADSLPDIFESLHCHRESHRNRRVFTQQVVQQAQSELEHTEITAVATMDHTHPTVLFTPRTQIDDPDVGSAGCHQ